MRLHFPCAFVVALSMLGIASSALAGMPSGWRYENSFPTGANLHAVWAAAEDDVFFGGEGGVILRWDGTQWEEMATPTQKTIKAIHGTGPSDVWAVGGDFHTVDDAEKSLILHFDGATWTEITAPDYFDSRFRFADVHALGADDVWAVTVGGAWIAHWDGSSWEFTTETFALGLEGNFYAITSTAPDDVYFSGTHGQIVHYDGSTWALERKTENGFFSVNLYLNIWAFDSDNVFVGDNFGEVYKRNPTDGSWTALGFADNSTIRAVWGRSATDIYFVSGDNIRTFNGGAGPPSAVSYQGEIRGGWNAASGAGGKLFAAGQFGVVHEISLDAPNVLSHSALTVGGGSALTLPKNRETRLTGSAPTGDDGGFFVFGDTTSRDNANPIYRFDGVEFHSSPFGDVDPERLLDPGVWVSAATDLKEQGTLIAYESLFTSPLAGGVHWQRPSSGWVEVKGQFNSRLRGIGALWKAPADTDPNAIIVYAIPNYEFNRSDRLYRVTLPHADTTAPSWELVDTLPTSVSASTSFSCMWGISASEIYFGTTEGGVFLWNGSSFVAETTPNMVDPVYAICGDEQGDLYAVGENGLAMHRTSAGAWAIFSEIEARSNDHFTGLAPSPDGMACYATQITSSAITGGGLGRLWKLDGSTATLEVRGLTGAPKLLVRTENAITGRNDLYAIGEAGIMVTTKPLPEAFSLERVALTSSWQPVGGAGVSMRLPSGSSLPSNSPMIATWREEQSSTSFYATEVGNRIPLSSSRWTIRQEQTTTGYTPLSIVDLQFQLAESTSLLGSLGSNLRLLRNQGNGWAEISASFEPTVGIITAPAVSGFSTWLTVFYLELEKECLPDNEVRLFWPTVADQHFLERSDDLGITDPWTPVSTIPTINGEWFEITEPYPQVRQFFRLSRQK